jgi:drug/metabolite transporter (DMT)-like permease
MDGSPLVSEQVSRSDVKWLSFPAVCYTVNNILVWYAIGNNDLATFGIFRETMVFWTAALWFIVFRVPPGQIRLAGLALILLGLIGNQIAKEVMGLAASFAGLWVLFMGLTNAISAVVNEVALKQNQALDLNVQNCIMYSQMVLISLLVLVAMDPGRLKSVPAFFDGFTPGTACTICLQATAGLLISRLLKYGDATMKTVAVCLRGPTVVLLTTAPASSLISAVVVSSGCLIYLSQGPLKPVESPPVKKESDPTQTEGHRSK